MPKAGFERLADRILQIDAIVRQLDVTVRERAFAVLAQACLEDERYLVAAEGRSATTAAVGDRPLAGFVARHATGVPAENVLLLAAWLLQQHGVMVFCAREIRDFAGFAGLKIPHRPDCTMRYASQHGQRLFERTPLGWRLTVHGVACLRASYPF